MWAFDALPREPHFRCTLPAAKPKQGQTDCNAWVRVKLESGAHSLCAVGGLWHSTRPAERRLTLLHDRLRSAYVSRVAAVPRIDRPRADTADVRRQEHDVCGGPAPRPLLDLCLPLPRQDVDEGSG